MGISSCKLNALEACKNPGLIQEIATGVYQIVYICPEFIDPRNKCFMKLAGLGQKKSVFAQRLCGLVIDEAHLVFVWRQFRTTYASLSRMRSIWPKIPIMTLSATFPPHVASYVHKSLELMTGAQLIRRTIDRPNIYFSRRQITNQSSFVDLDFITPNYACDIRLIPKTMIFVDSRPAVCVLTDYLIGRLILAWGRSGPPPEDVVADYSTILSEERRSEVLERFRSGSCRVIVCTDAAGMGIDIRDVKRVIQWKVTSILNLSSYFQRAGRAGRDPLCNSVAILFYQASLGQLGNEKEYELFGDDIEGPRSIEILKRIRAFDRGVDDAAVARRGKSTLKNCLLNRGMEPTARESTGESDPRRLICRGLLTQIATTGCMRACFLRYFDFQRSDLPAETTDNYFAELIFRNILRFAHKVFGYTTWEGDSRDQISTLVLVVLLC